MVRPAVVVDDTVIWPDGWARKLTSAEKTLHKRGELKSVSRKGAKHFGSPPAWTPWAH